MRKSVFKLGLLAIMAGTMVVACSSDDSVRKQPGGETPGVVDVFANINNGILNGTIDQDVILDASTPYKLTGVFSVAKGVKLTIPAGTQIIADGSDNTKNYIAVLQGAEIDVQGTLAKPVVMSSQKEGSGNWGGLVITGNGITTEGIDATAEVGGLKYGGTLSNDNSGSIKNLLIEGAGAVITGNKQFNGLSLYAVGSGTTIENIGIIDGADDGVEFFGGSVNVKNLFVKNAEDDAIDWTEGWDGTLRNAFVENLSDFSTVVEADGINNNPTIINLTATSTIGGTALQFKKQSGAKITGLSLNGYQTVLDTPNDAPLAGISINGAIADVTATYNGPATIDVSTSEWDFIRAEFQKFEDLASTFAASTTLDPNVVYNLTGITSVRSGATLTIPAGTTIIANGSNNTENYIAVLQGAKINVVGTVTDPVIMTSTAQKSGEWGGLVITGNAVTTEGVNATAEVGGLSYGGTNAADNSGSIKNLIIRGAGAIITGDKQFNGLSLYAVGSGTTIENIALIDGADDGVEFFGGSVSATNVYVENAEDDAIDWTEGWNGTLENTFVKHTQEFSTVVEADKINNDPKIVNLTAVSTFATGTALQFKKQSGATITGLSLSGYTLTLDTPNDAPLTGISINGADASITNKYEEAATVDFSGITFLENLMK